MNPSNFILFVTLLLLPISQTQDICHQSGAYATRSLLSPVTLRADRLRLRT
jgi:hypothetical protein